jgi:hypothetical protein
VLQPIVSHLVVMQAYVLRNVNLSLYPGELVAVVRLPLPKAFVFMHHLLFPNPPHEALCNFIAEILLFHLVL